MRSPAAAGDQWHGQGYFYFENELLNANDFQANANGFQRTPFHPDTTRTFLFPAPFGENGYSCRQVFKKSAPTG